MDTAQLNIKARQFTSSDKTVFTLKPIPTMILERLRNDQWGRPQPPVQEVEIGGKHKHSEANPNDPKYQENLRIWESEQNMRLLKYAFSQGIAEDPPAEFVTIHAEFFPGASNADMKYLWVVSHLSVEEDELGKLSGAIISQTDVTQEGLDAATDRFPGES